MSRLTREAIDALEPRDKRYYVPDSGAPGLRVAVTPAGVKSWQVRYYRAGKRQTFTIGPAGGDDGITPTRARKVAKEAPGKDLQGAKRAERAAAKEAVREARHAAHRTVGAYLEEVYEGAVLRHQRSGRATLKRIRSAWADLLNVDLGELDRATVTRAVNARRDRADETLRRDLIALRAMLARAMRDGLIAAVPVPTFAELSLPKGEPRVRFLNEQERRRFLAALDDDATPPHIRSMVLVALNTGLRRGELFALRWADVDLERRQVTVTASASKVGKRRHVQLNEQAQRALMDWRKVLFEDVLPVELAGMLVWESRPGKPFTTIKRAWATLCRRAGVEGFKLHDCRHDFASRLVMGGADLYTVSRLLGHSSVDMSSRYAHLAPEHLQEAVDRLNGTC